MFYGRRMTSIEIAELALEAPAHLLGELASFYGGALGLPIELEGQLRVRVGATSVIVAPAPAGDAPFYHIALRVPDGRFGAALDWLAARAEVLTDPDSDDREFAFVDDDSLACYFHDPAGTIVELISYGGLDPGFGRGAFAPGELLGRAEVGVVVADTRGAADALRTRLGLEVWAGVVGEPDRLAFVGRRGASLILAPQGRGWLPLRRPAVAAPLSVLVAGSRRADAPVELDGGRVHVAAR
jgi:catechol 2,3-dioxygenase-like lactoylglutathione lyase family enzyme